jgi:hypothetical protein
MAAGAADATAAGAAESGGSALVVTGETGGNAWLWTGVVGADSTLAVVCGSTRAEDEKGLLKGVSAKRIVSELQAADRPPTRQTKPKRARERWKAKD